MGIPHKKTDVRKSRDKIYPRNYIKDSLDSWILFSKKKSKGSRIFIKKGFIKYKNFI